MAFQVKVLCKDRNSCYHDEDGNNIFCLLAMFNFEISNNDADARW